MDVVWFFCCFSDLFLCSLYKPKFIKSVLNTSTFIVLIKTMEEDSVPFCTKREWKKMVIAPDSIQSVRTA